MSAARTFQTEPNPTSDQKGSLRRRCACDQQSSDGGCSECANEKLSLQRSFLNAQPTTPQSEDVPPIVHEVLNSSGEPLDASTRTFFEARFGHDFSRVRVHTDERAVESARLVNARAYTVGENVVMRSDQYSPSSSAGRRLLAHELTHVVQQANSGSTLPQTLMRDFALEPPPTVPVQRELTASQIRAAIRYNRASYTEESTRMIQDLVGADQTGTFDEATVLSVAAMQREYGLVPADGKVGPDTYDHLIHELQEEGVTPGECVTMFQIVGPVPLAFTRTSSTQGVIDSRFEIHARFDPRCNCSDFEYRQFISGHVELLETAPASGATPPATSGCATLISSTAGITAWDMDGCFSQLPSGRLRAGMREDGDTAIASRVAGRRYGHRSFRTHPTDRRDRYLPDRATGCIYDGFDVPELNPVPATPGDTGDVYDWQMRFRGIIQRTDGTVVSEKWWNLNGTVTIP